MAASVPRRGGMAVCSAMQRMQCPCMPAVLLLALVTQVTLVGLAASVPAQGEAEYHRWRRADTEVPELKDISQAGDSLPAASGPAGSTAETKDTTQAGDSLPAASGPVVSTAKTKDTTQAGDSLPAASGPVGSTAETKDTTQAGDSLPAASGPVGSTAETKDTTQAGDSLPAASGPVGSTAGSQNIHTASTPSLPAASSSVGSFAESLDVPKASASHPTASGTADSIKWNKKIPTDESATPVVPSNPAVSVTEHKDIRKDELAPIVPSSSAVSHDDKETPVSDASVQPNLSNADDSDLPADTLNFDESMLADGIHQNLSSSEKAALDQINDQENEERKKKEKKEKKNKRKNKKKKEKEHSSSEGGLTSEEKRKFEEEFLRASENVNPGPGGEDFGKHREGDDSASGVGSLAREATPQNHQGSSSEAGSSAQAERALLTEQLPGESPPSAPAAVSTPALVPVLVPASAPDLAPASAPASAPAQASAQESQAVTADPTPVANSIQSDFSVALPDMKEVPIVTVQPPAPPAAPAVSRFESSHRSTPGNDLVFSRWFNDALTWRDAQRMLQSVKDGQPLPPQDAKGVRVVYRVNGYGGPQPPPAPQQPPLTASVYVQQKPSSFYVQQPSSFYVQQPSSLYVQQPSSVYVQQQPSSASSQQQYPGVASYSHGYQYLFPSQLPYSQPSSFTISSSTFAPEKPSLPASPSESALSSQLVPLAQYFPMAATTSQLQLYQSPSATQYKPATQSAPSTGQFLSNQPSSLVQTTAQYQLLSRPVINSTVLLYPSPSATQYKPSGQPLSVGQYQLTTSSSQLPYQYEPASPAGQPLTLSSQSAGSAGQYQLLPRPLVTSTGHGRPIESAWWSRYLQGTLPASPSGQQISYPVYSAGPGGLASPSQPLSALSRTPSILSGAFIGTPAAPAAANTSPVPGVQRAQVPVVPSPSATGYPGNNYKDLPPNYKVSVFTQASSY